MATFKYQVVFGNYIYWHLPYCKTLPGVTLHIKNQAKTVPRTLYR